ncbi:AI-2E family transporter [uncultured Clostridium sp.]|uniref:AI-2E family transporter n=1 Tax=uncultured Clostridium sp. TaxID=59620 RepID=UPI0025EC6D88|nr:AI-2E family transporter [uncultured Clostridium sp.]
MKIEFDKKLFKYAVYIGVTVIAIYIVFLLLFHVKSIFATAFRLLFSIINLLKPLLMAIVIAYILYPVTKIIEDFLKDNKAFKIENSSKRRIVSVILSYITVLALLTSLIWGIYFMIGGQLSRNTTISNIISDINAYFANNPISSSSIKEAIDNLNSPIIDSLQPYIMDGFNTIQTYILKNFSNMTSSIVSIGSSIATFFIAFIISFYLLKDSEYFIGIWKKLYYLIFRGNALGNKLNYIFSVIHGVFGKFIKGQFLEALSVGILSSIALSIVGIKYSFVIGAIAGISNMIPYVGPIVGTVLAAVMGLLSGSPIKILYAIIAMLIVQQIDNHFLAPQIVGNSVGLHPVFTMMAILIGGNIGGLIGMLIAVPLAASFKLLFTTWYHNNIENSH